MNLQMTCTALVTTLALLASVAAAQAQTHAGYYPAPRVELLDHGKADALMARADRLVAEGRVAAARPLYRQAADLQLQASVLPSKALRTLANAFFFAGQDARAAAVLEELARHAARYGDLAGQAEAQVDAAWLYARLGDAPNAWRHVEDVALLLRSPYMPDEVRRRLAWRLP